jgi:hypothetical protein
MGEKHVERQADEAQDLREIPRWTRRYARNRTLHELLALIGALVLAGAYGGLVLGVRWAHARGNPVLTGAFAVLLAGLVAFCLRYSIYGRRPLMRWLTERLYGKEGTISLDPKREFWAASRLPLPVMIAAVLALCFLLEIARHAAPAYRQPVVALGCVPLLIYQWVRSRPNGSPFLLLLPALYGLHALLLVAGVPIYLRVGDKHEGLVNVLGPFVAYTLVAALAGHLYSRLALRRLRTLARTPESANGAEEVGR